MDLSWADVAQPLVAGLAGILGVYLIEETLGALRRSGLCPDRWNRGRTSLVASGQKPVGRRGV